MDDDFPPAGLPAEREVTRTVAALVAAVLDGDDARATALLTGPAVHPLLAAAVAVKLAWVLAERFEDPDAARAAVNAWLLELAAEEPPESGAGS